MLQKIKKEDDQYETIQKIGEGTLGVVFKVIDKNTSQIYAKKILKYDMDTMSEIYSLKDLNNKYIIPYTDIYLIEDEEKEELKLVVIMEVCEGGSLRE